MVYTFDLVGLVMTFVGAAYVIVKSVEAAISFSNGYYAVYGDSVVFSSLLGLYQVLVVVLW